MIPVQNIYYMLSYAFRVLNEKGYRDMAAEPFDNVTELCAAILIRGVSAELKRGLGREYVEDRDSLVSLRGKIEIADSVKSLTMIRKQMVCTYDEFTENSYPNRILKTTMMLLLRSDLSRSRKREIRKLLVHFGHVDELDIHRINWHVHYDRNNQTCRMLVSICYLLLHGLLQTASDGSVRMMDFMDSRKMYRLYEKFILEYYRREFPQLNAASPQIPWALDDNERSMLPVMQSDIMLSYGGRVLIIDAKYYEHATQSRYAVHKIHSYNLYQIFTYVKNRDLKSPDPAARVSGMLLYAGTDEDIKPDQTYHMSGNRIVVKTLDLGVSFSQIAEQLNQIAGEYFDIWQPAVF